QGCFASKSSAVGWLASTATDLTLAGLFPRAAPSGAAIARLRGAASPVPTVAGRIAVDSVAGWQDPAAAWPTRRASRECLRYFFRAARPELCSALSRTGSWQCPVPDRRGWPSRGLRCLRFLLPAARRQPGYGGG